MDIIKLLVNQDITIISLGYNCNLKRFIEKGLLIDTATNFFDYTGASMWSINELFFNDFQNLFNIDDYKIIKIKYNSKIRYVTNIKYYLRFPHDLPEHSYIEKFSEFKDKYTRRIDRLYNILKTSKKIIFFRYEESLDNRIIYEHFKNKFNVEEFEHIKNFSKIIKDKFVNLDFHIIFLTHKYQDSYDSVNKIISINIGEYAVYDWNTSHVKFINILSNKYNFINQCLNEIK